MAQQPSTIAQYFNFNPPPPTEEYYRLALSMDGLDKSGKTHYAIMTAPQPQIVATADTGTMAIVKKAREQGRRVGVMDVTYEEPSKNVRKAEEINKGEHEQWKKQWAHFVAGMSAIEHEPVGPNRTRTVIWDTGTDIKNLLELAYFGKLSGNARQDMRTDMNAAFHKVFWGLYKGRPDLNILLIHKHKKQYVKDSKGIAAWNGQYERGGHSNVGFFVDLTLTFQWDPFYQDFYTTILPEHPFRYIDLNNSIIGQKWYATKMPSDPSTFWNLGTKVFPKSDLSDWI